MDWPFKGPTTPHYDPSIIAKPLVTTTFASSCIVFTFALLAARIFIKSDKQLAWVLTSITSLFMSFGSIPYIFRLFLDGGSVVGQPTSSDTLSQLMACFFGAYLLMDFILGRIFYPQQLGFLTCYIHHPIYLLIVGYVLLNSLCSVFALASILELPTFVLSVGHLHEPLRHDYVFACSFFMTRIAYHVFLIGSYFTSYIKNAYPSPTPTIVLSLLLPMHVFWFWGFINQQRRIRASQIVAMGQVKSSQHVFGPVQAKRLLQFKKHLEEVQAKRRANKELEKEREERHAGARVVSISTDINGNLVETTAERRMLGQIGRRISCRIQTLRLRPSFREPEKENYTKSAVVAY